MSFPIELDPGQVSAPGARTLIAGFRVRTYSVRRDDARLSIHLPEGNSTSTTP